MNNNKINIVDNTIIFELNTQIYSREIIYKTCYVFIDRMFIYLDVAEKKSIRVSLKGKEKFDKKQLEKIKGEFFNEFLNILLRENIVKKNQKILEYIVGGAITASLSSNPEKKKEIEESDLDIEIEALKKELEEIEENDFESDPLQIREIVPVGKKTKSKKKKRKNK